MFESIINFFKNLMKKESKTKDTARERLQLVLMQDRASVSADYLDLMKQEIIEVIKKYINIDENALQVELTKPKNKDGTYGAPSLYANIPILSIKTEHKIKDEKNSKPINDEQDNNEKLVSKQEKNKKNDINKKQDNSNPNVDDKQDMKNKKQDELKSEKESIEKKQKEVENKFELSKKTEENSSDSSKNQKQSNNKDNSENKNVSNNKKKSNK